MKTLFCLITTLLFSASVFAQVPPVSDLPQGIEFDPRHPSDLRDGGISPTTISENVELVGTTGGSVYDVFVQGDYAYVCAGGTLIIFDVSAPSNPTKVGYVALPDIALGVYVEGSYAYVACSNGLRVINVSDPENPFEVGFCDTPYHAYGVYVEGIYAYVANGYYGLRVIDVSDPENPFEVGFYDTPDYAEGVYVEGIYAYVANGYYGLRVIDVSDPENPFEVGFYDTPDYAEGVYVEGIYAYVANGYYGLRVIDVSDPENPFEVGFYDTPDYAEGVYVEGSYAYVTDDDGGLYILKYTGAVGALDGHVTDLLTGEPLRALVIAINDETGEKTRAVSDVEGYYEVLDLEPGTYRVLCYKKGYRLGIRKSEVIAGETVTVNFRLRPK
ncbi:carboxypeptidase regulatory-like domain-containing protein [bacterium]|nr:carboxypeptidase regulatory-like domain-containing protein [bacterium]